VTAIKFCGMTRTQDVAEAIDLGVDALGFVFWPDSPRHVDFATASRLIGRLPPSITPVGVFVRPTEDEIDRAVRETGIRVAQVHAAAGPLRPAACEVWLAASLDQPLPDSAADSTLLLDAHDPERHGGTGRTIDWARAAGIAARRRVMLAGGLTAANVAAAIRRVRPYGVDVASGIEDSPGVKNVEAMRAFVVAVHEAHP
jgi:phosphoribosylanthranilate isomerase